MGAEEQGRENQGDDGRRNADKLFHLNGTLRKMHGREHPSVNLGDQLLLLCPDKAEGHPTNRDHHWFEGSLPC